MDTHDKVLLRNLFHVSSGQGIAVSKLNDFDKYPVYGGNGIAGYTSSYNVEKGVMLIGRVGEKCGNVYITESQSWVSDNALIVFPKASFDDLYMVYLLEHINLNSYANRNAQPVISGKIIYSIEVPYMSNISEQKAIATTLSAFDTHIDNLTALIEKKKAIRDGALEKLYSGEIYLNGRKLAWVSMELKEVSFFKKETFSASKNRYISTENMNQNFSGITPYRETSYISGYKFDASDTLIANIRPYLKKVWFADFFGCCSADVLVLCADTSKIHPKLLYYIVANERFINYVMAGGIKGIKMPRGDKTYMMKYNFLIPIDITEQQAIADILTSMDTEIQNLEIERDKFMQIREGAMDDLLTGRVRLPM